MVYAVIEPHLWLACRPRLGSGGCTPTPKRIKLARFEFEWLFNATLTAIGQDYYPGKVPKSTPPPLRELLGTPGPFFRVPVYFPSLPLPGLSSLLPGLPTTVQMILLVCGPASSQMSYQGAWSMLGLCLPPPHLLPLTATRAAGDILIDDDVPTPYPY